MAPVSVPERERKRRERLKAAGKYNKYKAKNSDYRARNTEWKKALQFEKPKREEKARALEEERTKAKERQRKCRDKKRTKLVVVAPCESGYSSNQSLGRATSKVKTVLPMSPRKKREVTKRLSKQFNILKEEVAYRKSRLNAFALELKD